MGAHGIFDRVDEQRMVAVIVWEDEDGEERETAFTIAYEVCSRCSRCSGKGRHVNPSIDGHGLSREDFEQDPDFEESYFAGHYDVTCEQCSGARVTPDLTVDEDKLTAEQRDALSFVGERERSRADDLRTMRMEAGEWS
jgi:hypothetical protein